MGRRLVGRGAEQRRKAPLLLPEVVLHAAETEGTTSDRSPPDGMGGWGHGDTPGRMPPPPTALFRTYCMLYIFGLEYIYLSPNTILSIVWHLTLASSVVYGEWLT